MTAHCAPPMWTTIRGTRVESLRIHCDSSFVHLFPPSPPLSPLPCSLTLLISLILSSSHFVAFRQTSRAVLGFSAHTSRPDTAISSWCGVKVWFSNQHCMNLQNGEVITIINVRHHRFNHGLSMNFLTHTNLRNKSTIVFIM